jgi:hypothetical protein
LNIGSLRRAIRRGLFASMGPVQPFGHQPERPATEAGTDAGQETRP